MVAFLIYDLSLDLDLRIIGVSVEVSYVALHIIGRFIAGESS